MKCFICNKENVKLWRPYKGTEPLVCATCAEERQSPQEGFEHIWEKDGNCHIGMPTGKKILLDKWKIDDTGKIPYGLGVDNKPVGMTDQLVINLQDVSESYSSGRTLMVPAIPDEYGGFCGYTFVLPENIQWWENIPTR